MNSSKKSSVVIQSNRLIEARYSLTLGEQRLILVMVSMIHPNDADFNDYEISIKDLSYILNIDIKNAYREANKITDRIMERILYIPQPNGDLLKVHWVSSALHKQGSIVLSFDPKLRPYLLHLKREFTKYGLAVVTQFQSIYSIRIYQLLKQYQNIGWREFKIDELKEILGIKKNQYTVFQDFNKRVLNQARKEFEQQDENGRCRCDLTFTVETFRESRKIARLRFTIVTQSTEQPQPAEPVPAAKKQQPLSPEMLEFKKYLEEIGDTFMLDLLKNDPQAFMLKATFSNWQRAQA